MRPLLAGRALATLVALVASMTLAGSTAVASTDAEPPPTVPSPATTVNDFLPEGQNLSDCIGAVERPGCGSESRGGWRQTLTFTVMAAGLVRVFGRIFWAARKKSRAS